MVDYVNWFRKSQVFQGKTFVFFVNNLKIFLFFVRNIEISPLLLGKLMVSSKGWREAGYNLCPQLS